MFRKTLITTALVTLATCLPTSEARAQLFQIDPTFWDFARVLPDVLSAEPVPFQRGEVNGDDVYDMADGMTLLRFLFLGSDEPPCLKAADANDDGLVALDDAIHILNYLFMGREAPRPPFGHCGFDPTPDALSCLDSSCEAESGCVNPRAREIRFELVERTDAFSGRVRITAIFENAGSEDFVSSAGQQRVELYEGGTLVASRRFKRLAAGATISLSYERSWWTSTEFPPSFRARISYDPDIYIDGNDRNDDCESGDNEVERSGYEVNEIFH